MCGKVIYYLRTNFMMALPHSRGLLLMAALVWLLTAGLRAADEDAKLTYEEGTGLPGAVLGKELGRFNCRIALKENALITTPVKWLAQRDQYGATVWFEGDFTKPILNGFQKRFGNPAFVKSTNSAGGVNFGYKKEQCGILFLCSAPTEPVPKVKSPYTRVNIISKVTVPKASP